MFFNNDSYYVYFNTVRDCYEGRLPTYLPISVNNCFIDVVIYLVVYVSLSELPYSTLVMIIMLFSVRTIQGKVDRSRSSTDQFMQYCGSVPIQYRTCRKRGAARVLIAC